MSYRLPYEMARRNPQTLGDDELVSAMKMCHDALAAIRTLAESPFEGTRYQMILDELERDWNGFLSIKRERDANR